MQQSNVPKTTRRRRRFIENHVRIADRKILEIGALTTPTYTPQQACVKYMDWFSKQELTTLYKNDPNVDLNKIVDVEYIIKERRFSDFIDEKFDLIIGNHVIEHIPDAITWLQELRNLLSDDGVVFLSVPEKNYTFDFLRRETTFIDLLRCYNEKLDKPTYYQILDCLYYHRPLAPSDSYFERRKKIREKPLSVSEAMKEADSAQQFHSGGFHCHVFSRGTFPGLWSDLVETGLIDLEIAEISGVKRNAGEFYILLRSTAKTSTQ
jgi:hypothetical protein